MATSPEPDTIETTATRFLGSAFLCERAARISRVADWIAGFSEFRDVACDRRAVRIAAWFQDAWCCDDLRAGRFSAPLVLVMQPTDTQRERAADAARQVLSGLIHSATLTTAARAIREAGVSDTVLPEGQIIGEAVNLDSIGPLWLWGQAARCAAEDRPAASSVAVWERQVEYRYWAERIGETLRFERSRQLARHRSDVLDGFFAALRDQLTGGDRAVASEKQS